MKCPVCIDVTLLMTEKRGVEVDYCPECRGIWLDKGELEKLIQAEKIYDKEKLDNEWYKDPDKKIKYQTKKHQEKKSFLDVFDFFD
ncbi:MAG: zf-TFIIB domain-containing protein [Candidatus Gracilibacteria bacterium]|nr:zf-TFIIB domain-containing protein [Candidatus Gracilibacteria bacterium]